MIVRILVIASVMLVQIPTWACSSFASQSETFRLMAKSYDFQLSHGIALINKRNMKKVALVAPDETPAAWTSKYGSLTYTQFGRDFPLSGINEKGLAIEILWDFNSQGPSRSGSLPSLNEVQWIQYQLDTSSSVQEVIANSRTVRMKKDYAPIHYFVCDASGECATFEFHGTRVDIVPASQVPVLTNSTYLSGVDALKNFVGFGGTQPIPLGSYNSIDRFVILNAQLQTLNVQPSLNDGIQQSWAMLKAVRSRAITQWNMVHDLKNLVSHFKRMFEPRVVRVIDLKRFDLSCKTPAKILDLESEDHGDTSAEFSDYDPALNRQVVTLSGRALGISEVLIEGAAAYPESTVCTE